MEFFYLLFSVHPSAYRAMRWGALLETAAKNERCLWRATTTSAITGDSLATENMSTGDGVGRPLAIVRFVADVAA